MEGRRSIKISGGLFDHLGVFLCYSAMFIWGILGDLFCWVAGRVGGHMGCAPLHILFIVFDISEVDSLDGSSHLYFKKGVLQGILAVMDALHEDGLLIANYNLYFGKGLI